MRNIQLFNITPLIPLELQFLETLSRNLWWAWNPDAFGLFRRIDPLLWKEVRFSPLEFLNRVAQERLAELVSDDAFLSHLNEVRERFEKEVLIPSSSSEISVPGKCIAYFSLEYGIAGSIRLYSGGLGILAGDHLKSSSDLGLPLIGVGLLYRQGYFQQHLNNDGWQQESYPEIELHNTPVTRVCGPDNKEKTISIPLPDGILQAAVWRLDVGRVPLYLLDTNIHANPPAFRQITGQLYGGDRKMRIRQEILLGIGGFNALVELGYDPAVCHMNEGHAAFLSLARTSYLTKRKGVDKQAAEEIVTRTNVFTTHTPVPAGNEAFPLDLLKTHIDALQDEISMTTEEVTRLGVGPGDNPHHELSMTILGLRLSQHTNGVSKLHGVVERKMWQHLWPEYQEDEVPISHITNGIHLNSWLSNEHVALFDRYLGNEWRETPSDEEVLSRILKIPDDDLWRTHEVARTALIRNVRMLLERQYGARNATVAEISKMRSALDQRALTIGFARRFATYKRATLLLRDPDRFEALLKNEDRPVQFIFAGKAHPADNSGKALIQQIIHFAERLNLRKQIVFLEDYDMYIARYMVSGVDVWINTPRRPQEASGTSGMKAAANGCLNVSVLDGWWDEAYTPERGWAIGRGEDYTDHEYQDTVESQALYNIIENEVIPCFYDRSASDLPDKWILMMKHAMRMVFQSFTSYRMVNEYNTRFYKPAIETYASLLKDGGMVANKLVNQRTKLNSLWKDVKIEQPVIDRDISRLHVGDKFKVTSKVFPGKLNPEEIDVQIYYGPVDSRNTIIKSMTKKMTLQEQRPEYCLFNAEITCSMPGRYGLTTRVTPSGDIWKHVIPGFVAWANGS